MFKTLQIWSMIEFFWNIYISLVFFCNCVDIFTLFRIIFYFKNFMVLQNFSNSHKFSMKNWKLNNFSYNFRNLFFYVFSDFWDVSCSFFSTYSNFYFFLWKFEHFTQNLKYFYDILRNFSTILVALLLLDGFLFYFSKVCMGLNNFSCILNNFHYIFKKLQCFNNFIHLE